MDMIEITDGSPAAPQDQFPNASYKKIIASENCSASSARVAGVSTVCVKTSDLF